jgi:hypothetical protein
MKRQTRWSLLLATLTLPILTWAGQPQTQPPNWGQTDAFGLTLESGWDCEPGDNPVGGFHAIPDLVLTLTTSGNPVLVTFSFNLRGGESVTPGSAIRFQPVIDGVPMTDDLQGWQLKNTSSMIDVFVYTRIFELSAGTHTISAEVACQGITILFRGWVNGYELPSVRR